MSDSDDEIDTPIVKFEDNRVYFHAEVTRENTFKLRECLQSAAEYIAIFNIRNEFDKLNNIYLYIFSDGGEVYAAYSIIDYILKSKIIIITICEGSVASSGVLIALAGHERYIRKNAYMLIHEIRSEFSGKYSEIQDDMNNNNILMKQVCKYMNDRCNNELLKSKLNKILKHDKNWKPKKCLKYGLVTKII